MWAIWLSISVGIWITAAPLVLDYGPPTSTSDWVIGPLVALVSAAALLPVLRKALAVNAVFAGWLLLGPWLLNFDAWGALNSASCAIALLFLSKAAQPRTFNA